MSIDDIKKKLSDDNEDARISALEELARLKGKDTFLLLVSILGDKSWRVRKAAVESLEGFLGEEELTAALIAALRSGDNAGLRNSAAEVLIKIGRPAAPQLIEALKDPDADVRKFSADILGEIKDRRAIAPLVELLRDKDENVQASSSESLGKIGGGEVVEALLPTLDEDDLWMRYFVLEAISRCEGFVPVEPLVRFLDEKTLRKATLDALGSTLNGSAIPHIAASLSDKSLSMRSSAVRNIMRIYRLLTPDEKVFADSAIRANCPSDASLAELLSSSSSEVKKSVIAIIAIAGNAASLERLLDIASDDEEFEGDVTKAALRMGEEVMAALMDLFEKKNDKVRAYICYLLGRGGSKKPLGLLKSALSDSYGHTRQHALAAIGAIGAAEELPFIIPFLSDRYVDVVEAAIEAIVKIGANSPEEAVMALRDGLKNKDGRIRRNITVILGNLGGREALILITASLKDEDKDVRKSAATAMGTAAAEEGYSDGLEHLSLALTDEESEVRLAAVNAIAKFRVKEVEKLLLLALRDENTWVRCAAVKNLALRGGEDSLKALERIIEQGGVAAITAIDALFSSMGSNSRWVLEKALSNIDLQVAKAAQEKLRKLL